MFERTLRLVGYGFDPDDPKTATAVIRSNTVKPQKTDLSLNSKAKAAIVVRLLLNNGADIPQEELPEDSQATPNPENAKYARCGSRYIGLCHHRIYR